MALVRSEFMLKVEFVQENTKFTEMDTLFFTSRPTTFKEVKERIEDLFLIPACVQTLRYEGSVVADIANLENLYLQSGDTVQVCYPAKGATKEVKKAFDWLSQSCKLVRESNESDTIKDSKLFIQLFMPSRDVYGFLTHDMFATLQDRILVNCRHFDFLGGLKILVEFHTSLVDIRMKKKFYFVPVPFILFERLCCTAMACFCMNEYLAGRIVQCGGHETLIESFLLRPADNSTLTKDNMLVIAEGLRGIYK